MITTLALCGLGMSALAGLLVGCCSSPIKLMRHYHFEHWALISSLVGHLILPWMIMLITCPDALAALSSVPTAILVKANLLSMAWGIANVLCCLCLIKIGFSLTMGLLTGIGLPIGVLLPMMIRGSGQFADGPSLGSRTGLIILMGVLIMAGAVVLIALAGFGRSKVQGNPDSQGAVFRTGLLMAAGAGILQVGLSFAFVYTQGPITECLTARGASPLCAGLGIWALTMPGGALINLAYPLMILRRNRSWRTFTAAPKEMALSVLIGVIFVLFLMVLGLGMSWLGVLGASIGFGIYQGMQISSTQLVGFITGEWRGVVGRPRRQMLSAIGLLLIGIAIIAVSQAA